MTILIEAIKNKDVDSIKAIVKYVDVNKGGGEIEDTPLIVAVRRGDIETVNLLRNYGANANIQNKNGDTPLMVASRRKNIEMAKLLLEYEAYKINIDTQNKNGDTALMMAVRCGYIEMVRFFINRGADINIKNSRSVIALDYATSQDHFEIIDLLKNYTTYPLMKYTSKELLTELQTRLGDK